VTSRETANTVVLSSYLSPRRETNLLVAVRKWEAARATSATSTFFKPIENGDEGFVDGESGANNLVYYLWTKAGDL